MIDPEELRNYKVIELKQFLSLNGLKTSGNKTELILRLAEHYNRTKGSVMDAAGYNRIIENNNESRKPEVGPEDSVSQAGSGSTKLSTSSARARAAARVASIKAKLECETQRTEIEAQRMKIEAQLRMHTLNTESKAATAEEDVLTEFETSRYNETVIVSQEDSDGLNTLTCEVSRQTTASASLMDFMQNQSRVNCPPDVRPKVTYPAMSSTTSKPYNVSVSPLFESTFENRSTGNLHKVKHIKGVDQPQLLTTNETNTNTSTCYTKPQPSIPACPPWSAMYAPTSSWLNPHAYSFVPNSNFVSHDNVTGVNAGTIIPGNNQLQSLQTLDILCLPKPELSSFDGNPVNYHFFMNAFNTCIDATAVSEAVKLNRLFELCKGKALTLIKPCAVMNPVEGYSKARTLLAERFGNEYVIAEAWVTRIIDGSPIKNNGPSLQDFLDEIRCCTETLRYMGRLDEVDSRLRLVKLSQRLPFHFQNRWRKYAVDEHEKTGIYPGIGSFLNFLERVTKEVNDPVFGVSQVSRQVFNKDFKSSNYHVEIATENNTRDCIACDGKHPIVQCDVFKSLSPLQRLKFAKEKRLCFNCLKVAKHAAKHCKSWNKCGIDNCTIKHSKFLHYAFKPSNVEEMPQSDGVPENVYPELAEKTAAYNMRVSVNTTEKGSLPIVPVYVESYKGDVSVKTYALLDTGSNKTFCSGSLLSLLGIKGEQNILNINTLHGEKHVPVKEANLFVCGLKQDRKLELSNVCGIDNWQIDIEMGKGENFGKVLILIGQDNPHALLPLELKCGSVGESYGIRTPLGYTMTDLVDKRLQGVCNFVNSSIGTRKLENQVEQFWKIENSVTTKPDLSVNDRKALKIWDNSKHVVNNHFELDIPFKQEVINLPNNKSVAIRRLVHLGTKLKNDETFLSRYKAEIDALLQKGYAEKVNDLDGPPGMTWYIPHHAVLNPNKPDKVRIVYDCAAEFSGTSLNKEVLQGPDLTNKLIGVILRFREQKYGIMADIESMFYQVNVSPRHRDVLRFLWWEDGNPYKPIEIYRMTVHLFGGVWCPSISSYAIKQTANEFQDKYDSEIVSAILRNFYVDDLLQSVGSEDEGIHYASQLRSLLAERGFNLTKWISNSRQIIESVPKEFRAKTIQNLDLLKSELPVERALGIEWLTESDVFRIRVKQKEPVYTRRGLLSIISSVYDPLGIVCPFVIIAKKLFQNECRTRKGWDEELDNATCVKFNNWLDALPCLTRLEIPRCYFGCQKEEISEIQLHHFCDASSEAYGTVSYLRIIDVRGGIHCVFAFGKSRLSPIKELSIPRLELCAAVLAVQVNEMLVRELNISFENITYWTDSTIVLAYINNNEKRFHTFVANRLSIIHEGSQPNQWRYVNSACNAADDASRGIESEKLCGRWLCGPEFLTKSEVEWPVHPNLSIQFDDDPEVKRVKSSDVFVADVSDRSTLDELLHYYSDWYRLKRSVAWILRFIRWLKNKRCEKQTKFLTADEMKYAEVTIVKYVQQITYSTEIKDIALEGKVSRSCSIYNLEPILKNGILRVGGRVKNALISEDAKNQVILPREHFISVLIIRYVHEVKAHHCGTEYVLSMLRTMYWIPQARSVIKRVLNNCVLCKRLYGYSKNQRMSDLPVDRVVSGKRPFSNVGTDCFGPFYVKRGRVTVKRYGCIFTCLSIRAVHIEMLHSLEADSFVNALVRFVSRRGVPELIRSDNGTNFVSGSKEYISALNQWNKSHELQRYMQHNEIRWIFNPPSASHMGGSWERQIRSIRKVLNVLLRNAVIDDERLVTIFCEVEGVINNRPITKCNDAVNDLSPLTPNHLLLLQGNANPPVDNFVKADVYNRRWRHVQWIADIFWKRWIREYIPIIQHRQKWFEEERNFCVDDIVLLMDEVTPRNCWPMGRIIQVNTGRDGLVRSAVIKTQTSVLTRPVNKMCLLESCE